MEIEYCDAVSATRLSTASIFGLDDHIHHRHGFAA